MGFFTVFFYPRERLQLYKAYDKVLVFGLHKKEDEDENAENGIYTNVEEKLELRLFLQRIIQDLEEWLDDVILECHQNER
jgi:hypothetical protein